MKFLGEKTSPERQAQALRAVEKMLETWKKGRAQKMLRIAQKSWRIKHDVNHIWMPEIAATELQSINFISDMIIDAHVLLKTKIGNEAVYRIRFVSAKPGDGYFVGQPNGEFLYNPHSVAAIAVTKQIV